jgi:drug/metabolite transporter (DMT)-like permease
LGFLSRFRDWFLLVACNFIWACYFVLVKLVQEQVGPLFTTFFPTALATLMLIPIVRRETREQAQQSGPRFSFREGVFEFALIGVFGQIVTQFFGAWGTRLALASNGALLMLTLPIATAIMAHFLLGERMTRVRWISFAFAIVGVLECSGVNWKELNLTSSEFMLGNVMLFVSVFGSAFYNVFSKRLLGRYSPLQVLLYSYYTVVVFLLPVTLYAEPAAFLKLASFTPTVWLGFFLLAVFHYGVSMILFLRVLTRLDATQAGLSNYLIPFFGLVVAAIVLHERLTGFMILGGVLVLASTLLITAYEEHLQRIVARSKTVVPET